MGSHTASVAIGDVPVAAAVVDGTGVILIANAPFRDLVGDTDARTLHSLVVESSHGDVTRLLRAAGCRGEHHASALLRMVCNGSVGHVAEFRAVPGGGDDSTIVFVIPREFELATIDRLASRAHDLHGQGVVIGDGSRVVHVSDAAAEIYGRPPDELLAMGSLFGLFEAGERRRITELVAERTDAGEPAPDHFETLIERPDGSLLPVELWVKAVVAGGTTRTYTLISDATERRAHKERLAYLAMHDPLTGLANRHLLLDRLAALLNRMKRKPLLGALGFIDLDLFKEVNDRYGHAVGDEVLKVIATRLSGDLRPSDTAARLGGDEFVVLYDDVRDDPGRNLVARRLRSLIGEPIEGDGWTVAVGASVGLVRVDDPHADPGTLLDLADRSMYEQKRARREAR